MHSQDNAYIHGSINVSESYFFENRVQESTQHDIRGAVHAGTIQIRYAVSRTDKLVLLHALSLSVSVTL